MDKEKTPLIYELTNEMHFEYFNYNNGEGKSECYTILGYVNE